MAANGRFHAIGSLILLLLRRRLERNGRCVLAVLRARIEFGNLGIGLGKFLDDVDANHKKKQKKKTNEQRQRSFK